MPDKLRDASSILKSALEHYLNATLAVRSEYESGRVLESHFETALDELEQLESYQSLIDQSRRVLGKLRNGRSTIVRINTLPPELLNRIFHFTIPKTCDSLWREDSLAFLDYFSRSPGSLLHVCSHWRSVALGSHNLWTHIDLGPLTLHSSGLVRIARLHFAYSHQLPLYIHISLGGPRTTIQDEPEILNLCASAAKRAKSLELAYAYSFGDSVVTILGTFIANCTPGTLRRLVIENPYGDQQAFIVANDFIFEEPDVGEFWILDLPGSHLEEVLRGVNVLRLSGIYPRWTSQAYHGLTKLHLTDQSGLPLSPSRFAGMLAASPRLRFLYIGIAINDDEDEGGEPNPVHLNDLEVLHLEFGGGQRDSVLRLILPGPNPMRMYTLISSQDRSSDALTGGEHARFFARSNVTQLEAIRTSEGKHMALDLLDLLDIVPSVQVLVLADFRLESPSGTAAGTGRSDSQFAELRLMRCNIDTTIFRWLADAYPALTVCVEEKSCRISGNGGSYTYVNQWKDNLAKTYPMVHFVRDAYLAGEDWD